MDFDSNRGEELVRIVMDAYSSRDPKEYLGNLLLPGVETNSREQANFLFFVAMLSPFNNSNTLVKRAKRIYSKHSEIFDPDSVVEAIEKDRSLFIATLRDLENREDYIEAWCNNSRRLKEKYSSDARKIFETSSYKQAMDNITSFDRFGEKTGSMLLGWYITLGLVEDNWDDIYNYPTPLDTQVMKLLVGREVVSFEGEVDYEPLFKRVRQEFSSLLHELGVNPYLFHDAAWDYVTGVCRYCERAQHPECLFGEPCRVELVTSDTKRRGKVRITKKEFFT